VVASASPSFPALGYGPLGPRLRKWPCDRDRIVPFLRSLLAQAEHMQKRYNGAMATIQIRNVPEDVHRTYQVRAAAAGQSLQEYLLAYLVEHASLATPAEIVAEVRREMAIDGGIGYVSSSSVTEVIREDRASH